MKRIAIILRLLLLCVLATIYSCLATTVSAYAADWGSSPTLIGSTVVSVFLNVSYRVVGGGNVSGPWFAYFAGGVSRNVTLAESPTTFKIDNGTTWHVAPVIYGGVLGERWNITAADAMTGTAMANTSLVFVYVHQYQLTMLADPANGGRTVPAVGEDHWENASSPVLIHAVPSAGYAFDGWSCEGNGCYSGSGHPHPDNFAGLLMVGPITETAHFRQTADVLIETLSGSQFIIVDNNVTEISTVGFDPGWRVNSTHTLVALSKASCGYSVGPFSGCVYVFKQWIVNGVPQTPNDTLQIRVTERPVTIIGVWEPSYQNLEIATLLAAGIAIALLLLRRGGLMHTQRMRNVCNRCGHVNPRDNSFCGSCGTALTDATRMY